MAAKFKWALCACNEIFHKRFERDETGECSVCTGNCETPWHVLGECADSKAVAVRCQSGAGGSDACKRYSMQLESVYGEGRSAWTHLWSQP
jgi:hypothetical protein